MFVTVCQIVVVVVVVLVVVVVVVVVALCNCNSAATFCSGGEVSAAPGELGNEGLLCTFPGLLAAIGYGPSGLRGMFEG